MAKIFFDNREMTTAERDRQVKDRADRIREVSREEARTGVTVPPEDDLNFFKER